MGRLRLGIVLIACFFAVEGTAQALSVSNFTATAGSQNVHFKIVYCDAGGRLHLHFNFFSLDAPSGNFTDDVYLRISTGCYTFRNAFTNRYRGGLWALRLTMSDSHGTLLRRTARVYLP